MKNSRITNLLKTLTKSDLTRFLKFLKSPLFNHNPKLLKLYAYLRRFYPDFSDQNLTKVNIFNFLFPNESFNNHRLNKLSSELGKKLTFFISVIALEDDPKQQNQYLTAFFSKRGDDDLFQWAISQSKNEIEGELSSSEKYLHSYHLNWQQFAHYKTEKTELGLKPLHNMYNYLELNYLSFRLRYACECRFRSGMLKEDVSVAFDKETLKITFKYANEEHPLIHLYCELLQCLNTSSGLREFKELRKLYERYLSRIDPFEREAFLRYLINFCIRKYHSNQTNFLAQQYELITWGMNEKVFAFDGFLPDNFFINSVATAAVAKEIKIAKQFILSNQHLLDPETKGSTVAISYAYCFFNEANFVKTLRELHKVVERSYPYAIRKQSLLLRTNFKLFQQDKIDYPQLENRMIAFERFFSRNTKHLPVERIATYQNLLWFIRQLVEYLLDPEKPAERPRELLEEIPLRPPAAKDWLMVEVNQLL